MPSDQPPVVTLDDLSWPDARRRSFDAGAQRARSRASVVLPLDDARDLVLADDVRSRIDLPSFDTAAMDGWAMSGAGPWTVVGEAWAGHPVRTLHDGQAIRISTGAVVPTGAGVLRSERGEEAGGVVMAADPAWIPSSGTDMRMTGEEVRSGEVVLAARSVLTPPSLGLAAASGHDVLPVLPPPTVAVVILGDELVEHGVPGAGQVRDALAPQLPGWMTAMHAALAGMARVTDSFTATREAIESIDAEVIVTTGGTARGEADHVRGVVELLGGEWLVDGVAVRPGHPMKLAALSDGRVWIALPGNPLAAISSLITLGEPLLAALSGREAPRDMQPGAALRRPLAASAEVSPGAHRLIPARIHDGQLHPVIRRGPAMLSGLAVADVFIIVPPGSEALRAGSLVDVLPLPWGTGLVV